MLHVVPESKTTFGLRISALDVPIRVPIGPVIVPVYYGRFRHPLTASTADRAPYQGFIRFLAVIRPLP